MGEPQRSRHPVNLLIRRIIAATRQVTPGDVEQIVERIATVSFDPAVVRVPLPLRGVSYLGQELGNRAPSMLVHLVRRVIGDRQWVEGTVAADYLRDLRAAARAPEARVSVYERRGGYVAAVLCSTAKCVPPRRHGADALPYTLVVYSADRGIIVSGYQISGLDTVSMPEDAKWLK